MSEMRERATGVRCKIAGGKPADLTDVCVLLMALLDEIQSVTVRAEVLAITKEGRR